MWLVARVARNLSCDWLHGLHATCHVTGCTCCITSVRHKLSLDPFSDYCWRCSLSSKSCCGMLHRELLYVWNMNFPVQNKSFSLGFFRDQYHLLHLRTATSPHLRTAASPHLRVFDDNFCLTELILALWVQPVMWPVAGVAKVACNLSCDWLHGLQRLHATCHVTGCRGCMQPVMWLVACLS